MKKILSILLILASFVTIADNITKSDILRGCIARYQYHGNVLPSSVITDASGNGNYGTLSGSYIDANGIYFNGSGNNVGVLDSSVFPNGTSDFTISIWVNVGSPSENYDIMSQWREEPDGNLSWVLYGINSSKKLNFGYSTTGNNYVFGPESSIPLPAGWQLVSVIRNNSSGTIKMYFGTTEVMSMVIAPTTALYNSSLNVYIGGRIYQGKYYFAGKLDGIQLFDRALTETELSTINISGRLSITLPQTVDISNCKLWLSYAKSGIPGTFHDTSGNNNNGTLVGNTYVSSDGIAFDGDGDYVQTTVTDSLHTYINSGFTICGWSKWRGTVTNDWWRSAFMAQDDGPNITKNKWVFGYDHATGSLIFHINEANIGGTEVRSVGWSGVPALDTWIFVAISKSGNDYSFYVNGTKYGTVTDTLQCYATSVPLIIGTSEGGANFNGSFDDFRFYSRALSADELKQIYHSTKGRH